MSLDPARGVCGGKTHAVLHQRPGHPGQAGLSTGEAQVWGGTQGALLETNQVLRVQPRPEASQDAK